MLHLAREVVAREPLGAAEGAQEGYGRRAVGAEGSTVALEVAVEPAVEINQ